MNVTIQVLLIPALSASVSSAPPQLLSINEHIRTPIIIANEEKEEMIEISPPPPKMPRVVVPFVGGSWPQDLPFSKREAYQAQEILKFMGIGNTHSEWLLATEHPQPIVRNSAYYLLAQLADPNDESVFRRGLNKTDIYQVQALSAYALVRLGDDSARNVLKKIAQLDLQFFSSDALNAAGKLGELGDASAFEIIVKGMESSDPLTRRVAVENVMSFVALQGETYAPGKTIDVWTIYAVALADDFENTEDVALAQLEELNLPQAIPLLQKYLKR